MGVYIKGMKKPKCCGACLLCLDDSRIANGYCMIFHRCVNMAELEEKCPLVEVKTPHGRLIDADFIERLALNSKESDDITAVECEAIVGANKLAPTVIEAEVE